MAFFEAALRESISQGDIFSIVPSTLIKMPVHLLDKAEYIKGARQAYPFKPWDEAVAVEKANSNCNFSAARAIMLSHDCEIDNDNRYRTMALLRAIDPLPREDRERIRGNRDFRFFHVPAEGDSEESYVDFRRITTIAPELVPANKRVRSISDQSRKALSLGLILFLTRRTIELDGANATAAE